MSLVVLDKVSLAFGPRKILDDASVTISLHDRIGLVGMNGTGKTTLLRLILGTQAPDSGDVVRHRGVRIGYLPQDVQEAVQGRLLESVLSSAPGKESLDRRLAEAEESLRSSTDPQEQMELSETLYDLHTALDHFESLYAPHEAEKILLGLGFTTRDFIRPLEEFSGGWKTRAVLAGLLFTKPDLLLLDEPTNHLDVPSLIWFEDFLRGFKNAVVLISHDREFLDKQIARILSFEVEGLRMYTGNFEQYLDQREEEEKIILAQAKNQERLIAQTERFIRRFRYKATKARQVQSRIKQLEKIERVVAPGRQKSLDFNFRPAERSGRETVKIRGISKSFGPLRLFDRLSLNVFRGERVAIIGKNGAGKTTLLRMIAREIEPDAGEIEYGHNVTAGYYAQHHTDQISGNSSILQEVWSMDLTASQTHVRGLCGMFLFSGDDVEKSCGVLSGGEKARVVLAKLMMRPGNLLLMDEPTNHLDLYAAEALADALEAYDGTIVFVSHNRSFVNRLSTRLWDLDGSGVSEFPGNLDDYQYHLKQREEERAAAAARIAAGRDENPGSSADKTLNKKEARRVSAHKQDERNKALRPIKRDIEELEERIAKIETEQADLSAKLADPEFYGDGEKARDATIAYRKNSGKLEELMARWEFKQEQLASTEAQFTDD